MKDEEMAEEIANKRCHEIMCYGHCSFNSPKHHRCGEWHREYNCALAGLKAGRPEWHNLKENPEDLPKDHYIKQTHHHFDGYVRAWYNEEKDEWISENGLTHYHGSIEQWCELPTL